MITSTFGMIGRFLSLVILAGLLVACQTTPQKTSGYAPVITSMKILKKTFSYGEFVTVFVRYKNLEGGFKNAEIFLDYKGSNFNQRRHPSSFMPNFRGKGTTEPSGEIEVRIDPKPTDDPSFDLTYYLKVCGKNGCSEWASASTKYVRLDKMEQSVTKRRSIIYAFAGTN